MQFQTAFLKLPGEMSRELDMKETSFSEMSRELDISLKDVSFVKVWLCRLRAQ